MNRSGAPAACQALCWAPSISPPQMGMEGVRQGIPHLRKRYHLLLPILGWPRGDEANSTSTKLAPGLCIYVLATCF